MPPAQPGSVPGSAWYRGLRVTPQEVRTALRLVLVLTGAGVPAGLLWLALAPRREFQVVEGGFQALEPQSEALIGADGWLMLVTGLFGVLAALLVWRFPRERGVGVLLGLAIGMVALSVVAWQMGEVIGTGASEAEQAQLGAIVSPPLQLRAIPALVMGPFLATLIYLVMVSFVRRDDLLRSAPSLISSGSTEPLTGPGAQARPATLTGLSAPAATGVTEPPAAPSSGPPPTAPGDPRP